MSQQIFEKVKIPEENDKIFKDECIFSFDSPESITGLYICMNSFIGLGKRFVEEYAKKSGNFVFLHFKKIKKEKETSLNEPQVKKPTRLAIGLDGGFSGEDNNYEVEDVYKIVVLPHWTELNYNDPSLPSNVTMAANGIISADSALKRAELEALANTWDGEKRIISKHADTLIQLPTSKKIPPSGWKCEKCDKTDNLWLNLSDGSILCGRKFFDGTGGNNHAVEHFKTTNFPLAVKLGTITPNGADVYSYDEDDMVEDPNLARHLTHFGIDLLKMQKTEKTMIELELDLNQRAWEWSALQESGSQLEPLYGPGYTGCHNLGNSCYLNSLVQLLFNCLSSFQEKYFKRYESLIKETEFKNQCFNFNFQICKLGHGLLSGLYSYPSKPQQFSAGIKPRVFKNLIGQNHVEFSTNKQQDVVEYLLHLFSIIEQNSVGSENPTDCLKFKMEDRLECGSSKKVKYLERSETLLQVRVEKEDAINKNELQEFEKNKQEAEKKGQKLDPSLSVRPLIPFSACLKKLGSPSLIEEFYSSAIKAKTFANKIVRIKTFPDFLLVQLQKFSIGSDWVETKLDVEVDMPESLNLEDMKSSGKQEGEELLPEEEEEEKFDEGIVSEMVLMGFPVEGCKKASIQTQGQGLEAAVNWIMQHIDDPDLSTPTPQTPSKINFTPDPEALQTFQSMGFSSQQATKALKATDNNLERAMNWIFSHQEGEESSETPQPIQTNLSDGPPIYNLIGFISHMGSSCKSGHYVSHMFREGKWVIYNDEKVALSENPPKKLGYLYLYKRV